MFVFKLEIDVKEAVVFVVEFEVDPTLIEGRESEIEGGSIVILDDIHGIAPKDLTLKEVSIKPNS